MSDSDQNVQSDFDYSRTVYYDLIEKGQEALMRMMDVADETAHPRSYEVLSGMIKNISDVNDRLMDLHMKNKEYKKPYNSRQQLPNEGGSQTNVLVTTTEDLQRMLIAKQNEDIIDVTGEEDKDA